MADHPLESFRGEQFVNPDGSARVPTAAEFEQAVFAPGQAATYPYAVIYQGEFETPWDGTAAAVRLHARALSLSGIPVRLTSFSHSVVNEHGYPDPVYQVGLPRDVELEVGELTRTTATAHAPIIRHAVLRNAEHAEQVLVPRGAVPLGDDPNEVTMMRRAVAHSTILYTVWERDRVAPEMARVLNRAGELWVPCEQNAQMLSASGVDAHRIFVMPHPFDPEDDICKAVEFKKGQPHSSWRLFYSIGRWEPRKGYAELIAAFLQAFKPTDRVVLTIKTTGGSWQDYPSPEEAVRQALSRSPHWSAEQAEARVIVLTGRGPRSGIIELHCRNNIYVSSSHGEAWCLPAFEALLAGNALVAVPYGGVVDFMPIEGHPKLSVVMPSGMQEVPASYHWPSGSQWCGYSVDALSEALRKAQVPASWETPTKMRDYELKHVGRQMARRVLRRAEQCKPEAARYYYDRMRAR